jgi:hypothetical protein
MYHAMFRQMRKQLAQLDKWLEETLAFAEAKKLDPNVFLTFRLAPDQFPLSRQIQIACDTAKLGASRLGGKEAPVQADTETTVPELRARVASVLAYLDGFSEKDFANAATAVITQPRWEGKTMTGADYFIEHVVPNFYFHVTTTYALLRHNCVNLGKRDYLGALTQTAPA